MVWVRRRMLWGREERKKGKTTVPFFSGDKVLLERKALDAPEGGWGQRAPVALGLQSHGKTKPPSVPHNSRVLWVAENYCRARALGIFHSNRILSRPQHTSPLKPLPSGSTLMEFILDGMAHSGLQAAFRLLPSLRRP